MANENIYKDLIITPKIENDLHPVIDQDGHKSELYLSTDNTVIGKPISGMTVTGDASTSLTVSAKPNTVPIATVRPDHVRRWHWKGMVGSDHIFTIKTENKEFQIWVAEQQRLTIDKDGTITLTGNIILEGNTTVDGNLAVTGKLTVDNETTLKDKLKLPAIPVTGRISSNLTKNLLIHNESREVGYEGE